MENGVVCSASVCTRQYHCSLAGEKGDLLLLLLGSKWDWPAQSFMDMQLLHEDPHQDSPGLRSAL